MQIHELNTFSGTPSSSNYLAIDDGTDTGKISGESLLAPVNTRIDNLVSGVTVDSEVIDGRVGADGVTYGSLGTAIRTQVSDLKSDIDTLVNDSFLMEENTNVVAQANGWRLNASDGLCSSNSNYCIKKFTVTEGDFVYVVSDDRFQFQNNLSVPSSGTSNRVGVTYGTGKRILKVPSGATCLILSTPITNSIAKMYFANSSMGEITDSLSRLNENFDDVLDIGTVNPVNWLDMDATTVGRILWDGTQDTSSSYKTTDYIPINNGDVLRLYNTYWNSDARRYELSAVSGERLALYGANKNYLSVSGQYPISTSTGYTVSNADAKYVRLSFTSSYTKAEVTKNVAELVYSEYFSPYVESRRISRIENEIGSSPKKIIDCWGDSRTEMNIGTSYTDYLASLLGSPYIVTNRGLSGQSIGQVSFRFGANEIFLTLENNAIPASGSVNVTGVVCSVGARQGYNMETADSTRGSRCSINGIQGMFVYHRSGTKTFTRDASGVAVNVFPNTKAIPEPYYDKSHMQIMWAGKNDFSYSAPYTQSGIKDNYDAMVSMIPHDKYIILGETYSNSSDYASGSENRSMVDAINAYLAEKYPNNFINIQTELVANGLALESITPTAQDNTDIANGFIPSSLMYDVTHPNQYGREAIAKIIYQHMTSWGWLS